MSGRDQSGGLMRELMARPTPLRHSRIVSIPSPLLQQSKPPLEKYITSRVEKLWSGRTRGSRCRTLKSIRCCSSSSRHQKITPLAATIRPSTCCSRQLGNLPLEPIHKFHPAPRAARSRFTNVLHSESGANAPEDSTDIITSLPLGTRKKKLADATTALSSSPPAGFRQGGVALVSLALA